MITARVFLCFAMCGLVYSSGDDALVHSPHGSTNRSFNSNPSLGPVSPNESFHESALPHVGAPPKPRSLANSAFPTSRTQTYSGETFISPEARKLLLNAEILKILSDPNIVSLLSNPIIRQILNNHDLVLALLPHADNLDNVVKALRNLRPPTPPHVRNGITIRTRHDHPQKPIQTLG